MVLSEAIVRHPLVAADYPRVPNSDEIVKVLGAAGNRIDDGDEGTEPIGATLACEGPAVRDSHNDPDVIPAVQNGRSDHRFVLTEDGLLPDGNDGLARNDVIGRMSAPVDRSPSENFLPV